MPTVAARAVRDRFARTCAAVDVRRSVTRRLPSVLTRPVSKGKSCCLLLQMKGQPPCNEASAVEASA